MTVASILKEKGSAVTTIMESASLRDAVAMLAEKKIGAVLVLDDEGSIAGMLSERDVVRELAIQGPALLDRFVHEVMTRHVVTASPDETIASLMAVMTKGRFRHVPVVHNDRLLGLVSIGDIVKIRIAEAEMEAQSLKSYICTG
ncbi:inosine-5-monophosphate dehydrogenase [Iodidimonas nitroreducens]|uniref:Inosine-5-monophosphate dehydrogenase n=1 Tax=Iodidimonas nitroreducens TaxID=1236968 RepID=A0A5A7N4M9_9PROT|nr:CBS domain-containing protein [Iodidimonas nitroreducens]GAK32403.1 CBS domain-containing protein CBSX3, mitochondrial [alpha proteobacterium Q-1]GER03201.1 inosine-5-monophosphate dehydrogenase [Iodidimonas nitroreducens]